MNRNLPLRWTIAALFAAVAAQAPAQYIVHSWYNFENGQLPERVAMGHTADSRTVAVTPFGSPVMPQLLPNPIAQMECGRYGVLFQPDLDRKRHLSIVAPTALERSRLGSSGRALYQADFYLPAPGEPIASTALLAATFPEGAKTSYAMYRFGVLEGGERVFFSYANKTPEPIIYESQPLEDFKLSRPGWHRFQIIFQGQGDIVCAVDAMPTSFSPIRESTLTHLNPGIMVTASKVASPVVADNLSIQWTTEDVPLPDSPWRGRESSSQVIAGLGGANTSVYDGGSGVQWMTDPSAAWNASQAQQRPMLVMFYAPRIEPYAHLKSITPNDAATRELLGRYILLKIDANQLQGGQHAQKLKVLRLPTLIVLNTDGSEAKRVAIVNQKTTWADVTAALQ